MRKIFMIGMALTVSLAMLLTSCKKEEVNNNGNNNGNSENPGGGGSGTDEPEYPSTAVVLPDAVTDIDGNSYDAVQIGDQVWMAENLRTTKYADGTTIPVGGASSSTTTAYRYAPGYNDATEEENMLNVPRYGYLYNWPAVMHGESSSVSNPSGVQGICPDGWHVPSDAEWTQLINYMKTKPMYMASGNSSHLAKALATTWGWESSSETDAVGNNPSTNNATGFSAPPAGISYGDYYGMGVEAFFWSTRESTDEDAYYRYLLDEDATVLKNDNSKYFAFSVRCIRD